MAVSASSGRFIDLAISVRIADVDRDARGRPAWRPGSDEEILKIGGRWDRRRKRWAPGAASKLLVLRFHRGQEAAARWFCDWLRRFVRGDWTNYRRAWTLLLIGGRRSGKTHIACAALVLFAVLTPKALTWAISPTLETGDELDEALKSMLPRGWYVRKQAKTGRSTTYRLANGSRILLKSAVKPQRLKAGRVDLVLLNELQELSQLAYVKVRAPIADRGGLVIGTANPPETPAGRWVENLYLAAKSASVDVEVFELDPQRNPWIVYEALASIAKEVDEKTYQRDVLGLFPPIGDIVFYAWSDRESVRVPPAHFVDVTEIVTKRELGRATPYLVGIDLQQTPHMAAAIIKFYRDPDDPVEDPIPWVIDEVVVEDADEDDLIDSLEAAGYRGSLDPDDEASAARLCSVVMDASAWWQDGEHVKNRTSDKAFRRRGWTLIHRPQKDRKNNPDIVERVKCTNARLKNQQGRRRMFVHPRCERIIRAMRNWENRNGAPYRRSDYAHLCDAVSYPVYRFFGRPKVKTSKLTYTPLNQYTRSELFPR